MSAQDIVWELTVFLPFRGLGASAFFGCADQSLSFRPLLSLNFVLSFLLALLIDPTTIPLYSTYNNCYTMLQGTIQYTVSRIHHYVVSSLHTSSTMVSSLHHPTLCLHYTLCIFFEHSMSRKYWFGRISNSPLLCCLHSIMAPTPLFAHCFTHESISNIKYQDGI